jgi:hypothetical protein
MSENKNNHQDGFTREHFAYLPYLGVYPNTSDMNELLEIWRRRNKVTISKILHSE